MRPNYKQIDIVGKYLIARKQIYEQIEILYLRFIVMLLATIIILHAFLFTFKILLFTGYNNQKYI